jgi:hypothetical protein
MRKYLVVGFIILIISSLFAVDYIRWHNRYKDANSVSFRQSTEKIYSSAANQLDIDAATEVEIAATTVDLNGILDVSGNLIVGGNLTGGRSGTFWSGAPMYGNSDAFWYYEDFAGVKLDSAGSDAAGQAQVSLNATLAGWKTIGDAGWTLTQPAGTFGGKLTVTCVTASDNEFYTQLGELGTETILEYTKSSGFESWVEFRFNSTDITASAANFFVGLAEEGSAAANFINDSGADIADKDVIGFVQWEANEDTVEALYQTAGGAFVDTFQTAITTAEMSLGIYFDGDSTLSFYKDDVLMGSLLTTVSLMPDGEELSPIIAVKQGAQDRVLVFDWIKIVNER